MKILQHVLARVSTSSIWGCSTGSDSTIGRCCSVACVNINTLGAASVDSLQDMQLNDSICVTSCDFMHCGHNKTCLKSDGGPALRGAEGRGAVQPGLYCCMETQEEEDYCIFHPCSMETKTPKCGSGNVKLENV